MNKKTILFAALVAAGSTAFVSCSSEDDLAQEAPKAPVAEKTVVEEAEGTPLKIKMVYDTRGTDWSATNPLDKFTLFATSNGGTTRWTGALGDRGTNTTVSGGTDFENDGSGNFAPAATINWQGGIWDFYALSDATFATEDDGQGGDQPAEHFDASPRTFTYKVPTVYADQTDLLVGAALGQSKADGDVTIPFYHALARIEKIKINFKRLKDGSSLTQNSTKYFLIKSITLKNVYTTGKFTFPATWTVPDGTSWTDLSTPGDYTIELTDFERDVNGNIKVFNEIQDPTNSNPSENIPTGHAVTTRVTGEPNFFAPGEGRHELPIDDEGLYLLPQALSTTVTGSGPYTLNGPYAEIEGFLFIDNVDWDEVEDYLNEAQTDPDYYVDAASAADQTALEVSDGGAQAFSGKANNYGFTHETMGKFSCPITTTLLPNKRYVLNIDLSSILRRASSGDLVFNGATIKTE